MISITYGFLEFEKIWTSREREERYIDRMAASEENVKKREKGLKITIIVLSLLVAASLLALAVRYIYLAQEERTQTTVTVPDNLVGEEGGAQGPETTGEGGSGPRLQVIRRRCRPAGWNCMTRIPGTTSGLKR